jgi:hypothetical protein
MVTKDETKLFPLQRANGAAGGVHRPDCYERGYPMSRILRETWEVGCVYASIPAPSKCASISSSVFPLVSGKNQVAVTK